jgi:hypothetical protein
MAFRYSPKIITDGLHFSIDPANHKSYPGSGTSVSDLVARNTSPTLENGAGYSSINGGVFSFDGIDDFLLISNNGQSSGFNTAEYTVEIWVYVNSTSTANTPIWSYDYTSHSVPPYYAQHIRYSNANDAGTRRYFAAWNDNGTYIGSGLGTYLQSANGSGLVNQWNHLVFTYKVGNQAFYSNSTLSASSTTSYAVLYYDQEIWIGKANLTGALKGYVGPVNFYTRALSSTEVAYNFNVHRNRFGL